MEGPLARPCVCGAIKRGCLLQALHCKLPTRTTNLRRQGTQGSREPFPLLPLPPPPPPLPLHP